MTRRPARREIFRSRLRDGWPGLAAQLFTFVAIFLPVLFQLPVAVAFAVQASAISAFLLQIALLACELRLPGISDDGMSAILMTSAAISLAGVSLLMIVLGTLIAAANIGSMGPLIVASGLLLLGQGSYVLGLAEQTRKLNYSGMMRNRFIYGLANLTFTLIACVVHADGVLFVVATALAYVVAAVLGTRPDRASFRWISWHQYTSEIRWSSRLMLSYAVGGFSTQAAALSVGLVGSLGPSWAVVCRVMGGMQTVGGQVVGPLVDVNVARSSQASDAHGARRAVIGGVVAGSLLAVLFVLVAGVSVAWTRSAGLRSDSMLPFVIGAVGFGASYVLQSPIGRSLGMIGSHSTRLAWDVGRLVVTIVSVLFLRGDGLLLALGVQGAAAIAIYVWLSMRSSARVGVDYPKATLA